MVARYLGVNIRGHVSTQDTFRSIEMKTGVPLQQKIHVGEHEKEKTLQLADLWMFFRNALYIRLFGYRLLSRCKTGIPN